MYKRQGFLFIPFHGSAAVILLTHINDCISDVRHYFFISMDSAVTPNFRQAYDLVTTCAEYCGGKDLNNLYIVKDTVTSMQVDTNDSQGFASPETSRCV